MIEALTDMEIVVEISIIMLFCFSILGNCLITSILDLWEYDLGVIESLTDEEIVEEINTVEFK